VIDNEPFLNAEFLRNNDFVVKELGDIKDIHAVADYPIVACDIMDVGTAFGSSIGGAHLVSEIKKLYPDKYVIAYSGASAFGPEFHAPMGQADIFVRRGSPIEEWVRSLDEAIQTLGDPRRYWRRVRRVLLDHEVSLLEILLIEDAFIRSIQRDDSFILERELKHARAHKETAELLERISQGLIMVAKIAAHAAA